MIEDTGFLAAIAASPTDRTAQLVYADWLAEHDRPEEQALRWLAAFKRRPCPFRLFRIDSEPYWAKAAVNWLRPEDQCVGYGWGRWTIRDLKWPDCAGFSMLPDELFRWLPKGNILDTDWWDERCYATAEDAFAQLIAAFGRATRPRTSWLDRQWGGKAWVPDWSLAASVPEE